MSNPNPFKDYPSIVVGTMRLGEWGRQLSIKEQSAFIDTALDLGLNAFDLADIYGHYTTESEFGQGLNAKREDLKLISKYGIKLVSDRRREHKIKSYDAGKRHMIFSVENSLRDLRTDYLDVLLLHRPDWLMNPEDIAEGVNQLKAAGKILHFGVSNFSTSQFEMLNQFVPLVTNQVEGSVLHIDPFQDGTFDQALSTPYRPMIWSPMGGGELFTNSPSEQVRRVQKVGAELQEKYNCELDQLLLSWIMTHPSDPLPVIGTADKEKLKRLATASEISMEKEDWYKLLEASRGESVA